MPSPRLVPPATRRAGDRGGRAARGGTDRLHRRGRYRAPGGEAPAGTAARRESVAANGAGAKRDAARTSHM
eukprot:gene2697-15101_t